MRWFRRADRSPIGTTEWALEGLSSKTLDGIRQVLRVLIASGIYNARVTEVLSDFLANGTGIVASQDVIDQGVIADLRTDIAECFRFMLSLSIKERRRLPLQVLRNAVKCMPDLDVSSNFDIEIRGILENDPEQARILLPELRQVASVMERSDAFEDILPKVSDLIETTVRNPGPEDIQIVGSYPVENLRQWKTYKDQIMGTLPTEIKVRESYIEHKPYVGWAKLLSVVVSKDRKQGQEVPTYVIKLSIPDSPEVRVSAASPGIWEIWIPKGVTQKYKGMWVKCYDPSLLSLHGVESGPIVCTLLRQNGDRALVRDVKGWTIEVPLLSLRPSSEGWGVATRSTVLQPGDVVMYNGDANQYIVQEVRPNGVVVFPLQGGARATVKPEFLNYFGRIDQFGKLVRDPHVRSKNLSTQNPVTPSDAE